MRSSHFLYLLATSASAAPTRLVERQMGGYGGSMTSNDIQDGVCKSVTFIMARGSTEQGNMGSLVGPATCSQLKQKFSDDVACQGVGGQYTASLTNNALPGGTDSGAIQESVNMFKAAAQKCPNTIIVAAGYSQGAAVMTRSVGTLPEDVKCRVAGVVLYGDTQKQQTDSSIPNYPKDQTLVICATDDGVCGGQLMVTAGHLGYQANVPQAVTFLAQQVDRAKSSGRGATTGSSSNGTTSSGTSSGSGSSSGGGGGGSGLSALSGLMGGASGGGSGGSGLSALSGLGGLASGGGSGGSGSSGLGALPSLMGGASAGGSGGGGVGSRSTDGLGAKE